MSCKRISLVWRRPEMTSGQFAETWLGEHLDVARRLPGLREYVIDLVRDPPPGCPDGLATVRFDTRAACDEAFATSWLHEPLTRTRDQFATSVQVIYVDERIIVGGNDSA